MPLSPALNAKLNEQITNELYSAQVYLAMSCQFEEMGLRVLAKLYRKQTEEEREHALKILDYIPTREGRVELQPLAAPPTNYPNVLAAIETALDHERKVTAQIHALTAMAEAERDYATRSFLQWFVDEQVEEVDSQIYLVQLARMAGDRYLHLEAAVAHLLK